MEEINIYKIGFNGDKARLTLPDGYEFKAEGNEVFVIKKKPKYREDWEGCFITYLSDDDCFNEVTFENSPQMVEIKLTENYG